MAELTPSQHAQLGCEYLDELLHALQSSRWCFDDTYGIEQKISEHAEALGIATPLDRPSKPEHETAEELRVWLRIYDPLTDAQQERLITRMIFAPPPSRKGLVLKTVHLPLDEREQVGFRQFVERLKREMQRRARVLPVQRAPSTPKLPDGAHAVTSPEAADELEPHAPTVTAQPNATSAPSVPAPRSTEPPALADEDAAVQAPALTKAEQLTLRTLAGFDATILASVRQIAEAIDPDEALSERTITPAIRRLVDLGLAERPEGDRQGARLTLKGRRLAAKIAD